MFPVFGGVLPFERLLLFSFQDFYDEQGMFAENFWPQSEPPQALAFNPRARVSKALTPPPTSQSINNQVSDHGELDGGRGEALPLGLWTGRPRRTPACGAWR